MRKAMIEGIAIVKAILAGMTLQVEYLQRDKCYLHFERPTDGSRVCVSVDQYGKFAVVRELSEIKLCK